MKIYDHQKTMHLDNNMYLLIKSQNTIKKWLHHEEIKIKISAVYYILACDLKETADFKKNQVYLGWIEEDKKTIC